MLFSSMVFLWVFLPVTVIATVLFKPKYHNYFLLLASLIFYAWGEPVYVLLMLFSIIVNWSFGLFIHRFERHKKWLLLLCAVINLGLLGYYKYFNFFVDTFNKLFGGEIIPPRDIALPIGISFFTFQALSYVIDLYRGNCRVQKNILNLALYISFFPQLIAGPIVRYSDIDLQIENRTMSPEKFASGLRRFLYGLSKKVIISNCMAEVADGIFALPLWEMPTEKAWVGALFYTFQIYYDFSGYSDMAIGLGRMFGFEFLENFNYPYLSRSIQEFWQRWHISLGTWFREYVYIPLGGNRKGKFATYRNLVTVFFLTGMWHGASWNFIFWGLYQGFFQIIERLGFKKLLNKSKVLSHIYTVLVFIIGWVFFRCESMSYAVRYVAHMLLPFRYAGGLEIFSQLIDTRTLIVFIIAIVGCGPIQAIFSRIPKISSKWKNSLGEAVFVGLCAVYCIVLLANSTYNPFIYFRF